MFRPWLRQTFSKAMRPSRVTDETSGITNYRPGPTSPEIISNTENNFDLLVSFHLPFLEDELKQNYKDTRNSTFRISNNLSIFIFPNLLIVLFNTTSKQKANNIIALHCNFTNLRDYFFLKYFCSNYSSSFGA